MSQPVLYIGVNFGFINRGSQDQMMAAGELKINQEINDILKGQNIIGFINPSAWGHLNPSSYCDVGRLFYGVFKLWSKLQRKK